MRTVGSRELIMMALATSAGLAVVKLFAVLNSGSSALLSSTVQSLIEASCHAILLYGLRQIDASPSGASPGSGKYTLSFWSFVVAIPLYALGAGVTLYEGIERIAKPALLDQPSSDLAALALGGALAVVAIWLALEKLQGARAAGLPLGAVMRRPVNAVLYALLVVSSASLLGHLIALSGVAAARSLAKPLADPAASVGIGLVMAAVAALMAVEVGRALSTAGLTDAMRSEPAVGTSAVASSPALPAGAGAAAVLETKSMPAPPAAQTPQLPAADPAGPSARSSTQPGSAPAKPPVVARSNSNKGRGKRRR